MVAFSSESTMSRRFNASSTSAGLSPRTATSIGSVRTQMSTRARQQRLASKVDDFLAAARDMEDRPPTLEELKEAKAFLRELENETLEDHLRSVDEILSEVPSEFNAKIKQLRQAERFVQLSASGVTKKVEDKLNSNWNLGFAVDVRWLGPCAVLTRCLTAAPSLLPHAAQWPHCTARRRCLQQC